MHVPVDSMRNQSSYHQCSRKASNEMNNNKPSITGVENMPPPTEVLDQLTERITNRLRAEIKQELKHEKVVDGIVQQRSGADLGKHLARELESHNCPICYEMMLPPRRQPLLLFPCGHTFCKVCMDNHNSRSNAGKASKCPVCRTTIDTVAPNLSLQQIIESFAAKRREINQQPTLQRGTLDNGMSVRDPLAYFSPPTSPSALGSHVSECSTRRMKDAAVDVAAEDEQVDNSALGQLQRAIRCDPSADSHQAFKYFREVQNTRLRLSVMENELGDTRQVVAALTSKVGAADTVLSHIGSELDEANERLSAVQKEIEFLRTQQDEQSRKRDSVAAERDAEAQRVLLIENTIKGLSSDVDKSVLLLRNFAPRFDTSTLLQK